MSSTEATAAAAATALISSSSAASYRRSYQCYHCNHAFHITATAGTTPFRCPRCYQRHLLPHHTIALTAAPNPSTPPPPLHNSLALDSSDSDSDWTDSEDSFFEFSSSHNPRSPTLKSIVDSLPLVTIADSSSCSICMDEFEVGTGASQLPCDHFFHKDCIVPWLNRSNTCPLCRHKLPKEEEEPEKSSYSHWGLSAEELEAIEVAEYDLERSLARIVGASVDDNSGWIVDPMRDADGDTLMLDAAL